MRGIGLSGQMHGLVILDAGNRVIRPSLIWCDQRSQAQVDFVNARMGRENVLKYTANPVLTGFTLPKLLWVRDHEPRAFDRVRHLLLETATDNAPAVAFWQRHGYRIEATLKRYYLGRLDAYEMRKILSTPAKSESAAGKSPHSGAKTVHSDAKSVQNSAKHVHSAVKKTNSEPGDTD